jgi:hypothetical protein
MEKSKQPDRLVLRGALIAGCSLWKPILVPVGHAEGGARLGGEPGKRSAPRTDEPGEDPAVPGDANRV